MLMIWSKASCEERAMFTKIAKNRNVDDFSRYLRFFVVLCHVNDRSEVSCEEPAMFGKIAKNRNVDDFSRYLRFFGVLCHVNDSV